jgi:hypothetical protein
MLLSCHQNAGQNQDIKIANRSFENVLQSKYLGMTVTNQNLILVDIWTKEGSSDGRVLMRSFTKYNQNKS